MKRLLCPPFVTPREADRIAALPTRCRRRTKAHEIERAIRPLADRVPERRKVRESSTHSVDVIGRCANSWCGWLTRRASAISLIAFAEFSEFQSAPKPAAVKLWKLTSAFNNSQPPITWSTRRSITGEGVNASPSMRRRADSSRMKAAIGLSAIFSNVTRPADTASGQAHAAGRPLRHLISPPVAAVQAHVSCTCPSAARWRIRLLHPPFQLAEAHLAASTQR